MSMENLSDIQAEQSVIGGVLLWSESDKSAYSIENLKPSDFYLAEHAKYWTAICFVMDRTGTVDHVTLSAHLRENKIDFDFSYLGEISKNTPGQANMHRYADIVKDNSKLRKALTATLEACSAIQEAGEPQERLNKALSAVSTIGQDDDDKNEIKTAGDVLDDVLRQINDSFESGGKVVGVQTGFENIDAMISSFKPGELIILAAKPGMGKTTLAMNIGENIAYLGEENKKVLKISLEMPAVQLMKKTVSRFGGLYTSKMDNGSCLGNDADMARLDHGVQPIIKRRNNLMIDDKGGQHISQIQARAKRAYMKMGGLDLIIVDYLGLVDADGESQTIRVGKVSAGLKNLAKNLNVPVLALCQLNRAINGKPEMKNLRDSGNIEQDADVIIFLHDEDHEKNRGSQSLTEIMIAKQRMGATGSTYLQPELAFSRFADTKRLPAIKDEYDGGKKYMKGKFE